MSSSPANLPPKAQRHSRWLADYRSRDHAGNPLALIYAVAERAFCRETGGNADDFAAIVGLVRRRPKENGAGSPAKDDEPAP